MNNKPESHARFGASSYERWANCPASIPMQQLHPPRAPNTAMTEGARLHIEAANAIVQYITDPKKVDCDPKIAAYVDYARELITSGYDVKVEYEVRLTDDCYTSIDLIAIRGDTMHIIDLKTGGEIVSPRDNYQLMMCAALAINPAITTVVLGIGQGDSVNTLQHGADEVNQWRVNLQIAYNLANGCDLKPNAGEWCKYCTAKMGCPAQRHMINKVVSDMHIKLSDTSAERIASLIPVIGEARKYLDSLEEYAESLAREDKLPGYKMMPGKKRPMEWTATEDAIADALGIPIHDRKLKTPTQVAAILGKEGEAKLTKAGLVRRPEPNLVMTRHMELSHDG